MAGVLFRVERLYLLLVLGSVWFFTLAMAHFLPQISVLLIILVFMGLYGLLLSAAMLHQKRKSRKYPQPTNTHYRPRVSILVPAHNEASVIEDTVRNLLQLDYPDFDLLVIDDRSTDGTGDKLKALAAYLGDSRFRFLCREPQSTPGKSAVLNEGLTLTTGEVVAVFDADARVAPDFLTRLLPFLAEDTVGAVQAQKVIMNAEDNLLTQCQSYEYALDAHFQCGRDAVRGAVELRGNGQLVKRTALESVGGWNIETVTDDLDISTRLHLAGWDVRFAPRVPVWEQAILHLGPLLKQRRRWAEGNLKRYLNHGWQILASRDVSARSAADMIAYWVEFLFPLWVASDYAYLGLLYWTGQPLKTHLLSSLVLLPMLTVFFIPAIIIAVWRFCKPGQIGPSIFWGIVTSIYMPIIWLPVVFWTILRVLFQSGKNFHWDKTEHYAEVGALS